MKKGSQGIVLITTMLLLSFIIMIATLLVVTGRNSMKLGSSYRERENAFFAAESGLAYAQRLINAKSDWCAQDAYAPGGSSGLNFLDGGAGMTVSKINGDGSYNGVRGVITDTGGEFYIAFCDGGDKTGKVTPVTPIPSTNPLRYYSVNANGRTSKGFDFYSYEWNGTQYKKFREVQDGIAHIIVEGRCGQVVRYVEAYLCQGASSGVSAPIVAGKGIDVSVSGPQYKFLVTDKYRSGTNLRAVEGINVHVANSTVPVADANYIMTIDRGRAITGNGTSAYTRVNGQNVSNSLTSYWTYGCRADRIATGDQQNMINSVDQYINWQSVTNSYLEGGNSYRNTVNDKLLAGTYVYLEDNTTTGKYKLAYVPYKPDAEDANYSDLMTKLSNGFFGSNVVYYNETDWKSGANSIYTGNNMSFYFTHSADHTITWSDVKDKYLISVQNSAVGIEPANLYSMSGGDAAETGYGFHTLVADYTNGNYQLSTTARSKVGLVTGDDNSHAAIVTTNGGDIAVEGELSGSGDILSSGNIIFQGESQLSPRSTEGLAIYSKGNIDLKEITGGEAVTDINNIIRCAYYGYWNKCNGNTSETKLSDIASSILGISLGNGTGGWNYHSSVNASCSGAYQWYNGQSANTYESVSLSKALETGWGIKGKDQSALVYSYLARNYSENKVDGVLKGYRLKDPSAPSELSFSDSMVKGLVFSEKNFNAALQGGSLSITGTLIAYGADPSSTDLPGTDGGNITIKDGKYVTVCYDPDFLDNLIGGGTGGIATTRVFWSSWSP
ncbi:MAG: pilus assembly PilX N-terminal domain-containing protein [Vulcanimicrobiota bacterium]